MKIPEIFAENVFNDEVMRSRLPKETYRAMRHTIDEGTPLEPHVAMVVANAMKDWAIDKGATHYTHWFQPMTGITAEKHDSFLSVKGEGDIIMEFSGKELIKGEPDASSFPSGGLRATFEARGYTAWDPTSYAFIKDGTLCIPTAFCSYSGFALDKKTPLLRSMEALNKQALRILRLFGNKDVKRVSPTVGPEQEYFLIDKALYEQREDLKLTGRTLFGAKPPKGQELEDHYFGTLRPRVLAFMQELDEELWKLGIYAKTEHNEAAPSQHELAPVFTSANVAADHNQITMELMKKIAGKHNLACLLHEKPFAGVNGSGKHNNWSLTTDGGVNLLEPGNSPYENAQFLLFFTAVIKAVDEYQDLLRVSVATASNDTRLGASEAPPAIVSMYIGEELGAIIDAIDKGVNPAAAEKRVMKLGVDSLPDFPMDSTDRNRTSPLAFTGNKFEFRMLGSSFSVSGANFIMNTIVAEELEQFAEILESAPDFMKALNELVAKTIREHKRIIFNGNNYCGEWVKEAKRRGLLNLASSDEALPYFKKQKNIELFAKHGVLSAAEVESRTDIMLENYAKSVLIEAACMSDMAMKEIYPAVAEYSAVLAGEVLAKRGVSAAISTESEQSILEQLARFGDDVKRFSDELVGLLAEGKNFADYESLAHFCRKKIIPCMDKLRAAADGAEAITAKKYWRFPTYSDLLFSV
ncbi:MAG: glutamine synthetase type III [Bacillota bacterium]|nr:MAG: glutamine synthetase type III [Bacillota bacterium]